MSRIGLLTVPASPLTLPTLAVLRTLHLTEVSIVSEGDRLDPKIVEALMDRTGGKVSFPTLDELKGCGAAFHVVSNVNDPDSLAILKKGQFDLLLNCGVSRKIGSAVLNVAPFGFLNCHPGRLPEYRGRTPVEWALWNKDEVWATTHFMVEAMDAGPIVDRKRLETTGLNYQQIRARMLPLQAELLARSAATVLKNGRRPSEYPPQGEGKVWSRMTEDQIQILKSKTRF
jgi:methionyl-tRNA formyltransferase